MRLILRSADDGLFAVVTGFSRTGGKFNANDRVFVEGDGYVAVVGQRPGSLIPVRICRFPVLRATKILVRQILSTPLDPCHPF